jgi:hypothetical protein
MVVDTAEATEDTRTMETVVATVEATAIATVETTVVEAMETVEATATAWVVAMEEAVAVTRVARNRQKCVNKMNFYIYI